MSLATEITTEECAAPAHGLASGQGLWQAWRQACVSTTQLALLCAFALLQAADIATTNLVLAHPGAWETNPVMAAFQTHLGAAWWLPKLALVGAAFFVVPLVRWRWPINFLIAIYIIIVLNNLIWV